MARTLCAAGVLAVDAYFLFAEGCFAAVAGTMHSHADWFGYAGELEVWGCLPVAGVDGQAVFSEEGAGLFLLGGAVVGDHDWTWAELLGWFWC